MTTPAVDRAFLDTNVLLAATDEARDEHARALRALDEWPAAGTTLYTSGQVLREYLAVATRPADVNGLGLRRHDAVRNVRALRGRLRLLVEDAKVSDRLLELVSVTDCGGKQVHDASLVATVLVHGVGTVVTMNTDDFARWADRVQVVGLPS